MRKFEAGKIYGDDTLRFEVISRTAKTVTYKAIYHYGKENERVAEAKRAKVYDWSDKEVFYHHADTIEA